MTREASKEIVIGRHGRQRGRVCSEPLRGIVEMSPSYRCAFE